MLIMTAVNITQNSKGKMVLERRNGHADYEAYVAINTAPIWRGTVRNHVRKNGAAALLRLIADRMEEKTK